MKKKHKYFTFKYDSWNQRKCYKKIVNVGREEKQRENERKRQRQKIIKSMDR